MYVYIYDIQCCAKVFWIRDMKSASSEIRTQTDFL